MRTIIRALLVLILVAVVGVILLNYWPAGWPFGGTLFYSDIYRVILQIPGVARLLDNQLDIWLDKERQAFCRDVPLSDGELTYSLGHQIDVSYGV